MVISLDSMSTPSAAAVVSDACAREICTSQNFDAGLILTTSVGPLPWPTLSKAQGNVVSVALVSAFDEVVLLLLDDDVSELEEDEIDDDEEEALLATGAALVLARPRNINLM